MGSIHSTVPHSIWALKYVTVYTTSIVNWYIGWKFYQVHGQCYISQGNCYLIKNQRGHVKREQKLRHLIEQGG